jgi:predicted PurR-regulated permease PerM
MGSGAPHADPPVPLPGASLPSAAGGNLPGANWGIGTVVLLAVLVYLGSRLIPVFVTLLGSLLLAALLAPLVHWLEQLPLGRRTLGRTAAAILSVAGALLILVGLVAIAAPALWSQAGRLLGNFPEILQSALAQLRTLAHDRMRLGADLEARVGVEIGRLLSQGTQSVAQWLVGFAFSIFDLLGYLVIPLGAFYILVDGAPLRDLLLDVAPSGWRSRARTVLDESGNVLSAWVRGQAIVCLAASFLYSTLFGLLGLPYWLAIGVFAGLLEVVPFLGAILVVAAISIVGLADGFGVAFRSVLAYVAGNQVVNYLIAPRFLSRALDLHPLVVVLAVLAGGTLGGPGGAVIAIPVVAVLHALTRRLGHRLPTKPAATPPA